MIGVLDSQVIEKFNEFKKQTNQYNDLKIEEVEFERNTIDEIVHEFIKGSTPKYSHTPTNTIVIKSGQARGNYNEFNFSKIAYLDVLNVKTTKYLQKGDILINTTGVGTAGRVTLFDLDGNYVSDSHITALRYNLNNFDKFYLLYFFVNYGFKKLEAMAEGSGGQVELSMDKVKSLTIPIPQSYNQYTSIDIQKAIADFFGYWKDHYTNIFRKVAKFQEPIISQIKKILIPSTFNYDKKLEESFNKFTKSKQINISFNEIKFDKRHITELMDFSKGKNASTYTNKYISKNFGVIPVYSGKTTDNGIMGYVREDENTYLYNDGVIFMTTVGKYAMTLRMLYGKFNLSQNCAIGTQLENHLTEYLFFNIENLFESIKKNRLDSQDSFTLDELKSDFLKPPFEREFTISIPRHEKFKSIEIQTLLIEFWNCIFESINYKLDQFNRIMDLTKSLDDAFLYRTFNKIKWSKK